MRHWISLFSFWAWSIISYGQSNLVPNYSFEDSVICPTQLIKNPLPRPWYLPTNFNVSYYANSCSNYYAYGVPYHFTANDSSFQYPKTGNGYAGLLAKGESSFPQDSRVYLQVKLKDSLRNAGCYYCEFWVNLPNPLNLATNNIAMWLTKTAQYSDTIANLFGIALIPGYPQIINYGNPVITDTLGWVKVSGVYVAQGGEQFITIGNFHTDANTTVKVVNSRRVNAAYYYVDDVSVVPLNTAPLKADAGKDTTINSGDSTFIGSLTNGLSNLKWYSATGDMIDNARPGFYVKPAQSTFYVLEQTVCGYTSKDTVKVAIATASPAVEDISLFPNPATGFVTIKGNKIRKVEVFNATGALLISTVASVNPLTLSLHQLSSGMYVVRVTDTSDKITTKKMVKSF